MRVTTLLTLFCTSLCVGCAADRSDGTGNLAASPSQSIVLPIAEADFEAIAALDARIFAAAFVSCDESELTAIMAPDLEFYHDKYGVIARDRQSFLDGTLPDCRNRQAGALPYLERRLTPGTMIIRQIGQDAAMQTGDHSFWLKEGSVLRQVERGRFTHIWERKDETWQITRVISYDHIDTPRG